MGQFLTLQDTTRYAVKLELTSCQLYSIEESANRSY